jgi:hypothetical protein
MPNTSKRQRAGRDNFSKRFGLSVKLDENSNSLPFYVENSVESLNVDENIQDFHQLNYENEISDLNVNHISCQTDIIITANASTQTTNFGASNRLSDVCRYFSLSNVNDLICIFYDSISNMNSVHRRVLSLIVYLVLKLSDVCFTSCEHIFYSLSLLTIRSCNEWVSTIIDEDDVCVVLRDKRGTHKRSKFYDSFPELEGEAKAYALKRASEKKSNFDAHELSVFIDKRFREIHQLERDFVELDENKLIRSKESCRADLLKWGARYDKNSCRPYFEGHEREDVVIDRKNYVNYFVENKDFFYYPKYDVVSKCHEWVKPMRNIKILLSHDESTFKSGEIPMYRWIFPDSAPFYNKGRGRSIMMSLFIVQHDMLEIFELNEQEWDLAIIKYPSLNENEAFLNYYPRSANAWIEPKKDNYFDNEVILKQFERLFQLLEFKECFKNSQIEIIVDNARTHSAKVYDVNLFNKKPSTSCEYGSIEWVEDGEIKR